MSKEGKNKSVIIDEDLDPDYHILFDPFVNYSEEELHSKSKKQKITSTVMPRRKTLATGKIKSEDGATSFFFVLRDPCLSYLHLPSSFKHIANNTGTNPGLIRIKTAAGLSWLIKLEQVGDDWFLRDGWKLLVDQLHLGIGQPLVFRYEGVNSFWMTVFSSVQDLQIGLSFFHVLLKPSTNRVRLPKAWFAIHFNKTIPSSSLQLDAGFGLIWNVHIESDGKEHYFTGFRKVVEEIPLQFGCFVVFKFLNTTRIRMKVFKTNCIQALLPLHETDFIGFDGVDNSVPQESSATVLPNVSSSKNSSEDVFDFNRRVEQSRLRLPKEVLRSVNLKQQDFIRMKYCGGTTKKYQIVKTSAKNERYVLDGWRGFMEDNGISKNDHCFFKYYKKQATMVVRRMK